MAILAIEKVAENRKVYSCISCDYTTLNNYDYKKHLSTDKHKRLLNAIDKSQENPKLYACNCGKEYKHYSSMFKHKKKCNNVPADKDEKSAEESIVQISNKLDKDDKDDKDDKSYKEMFFEVMNQNKELQTIIKQMIPKIGNNNGNISIVNNTVNNLTLLNDKCKDAISMNEFINSIDIDVKDLMYTAKKGLPSGISHILVEHLNNLPLVKRPIWCSDKKRKKLFIKEDEWSEDTNQEKTKEAIKNLSVKQTKNINKYTKENPDWMQDDKKKDVYISIVKNATDQITDKSDKIIDSLIDVIHLTSDCRESLQNVNEE